MTKNISQIGKDPLPHSQISGYILPVDHYAKAPHRRLFHFRVENFRTTPHHNSLIRDDLHALISGPKIRRLLSATSRHFKKHTGVYPPSFERPWSIRRLR